MTARRWIVCSKCDRPNWEDRKNNPDECSGCGTKLTKQSIWPEAVRHLIKARKPNICWIDYLVKHQDRIPLPRRIEVSLKKLGSCYGAVEICHLVPRHHGGNVISPANGVVLCRKHNDWLLAGREVARQNYTLDSESFNRWHDQLLHTSWSQLPNWIKELRLFLAGSIWVLTLQMKESHNTRMTP